MRTVRRSSRLLGRGRLPGVSARRRGFGKGIFAGGGGVGVGVCPGGVSARYPHLWTEFLTHDCENIIFPQRTVIRYHWM